eukprot:5376408-Pleurochrysis_carterae.AAC.2
MSCARSDAAPAARAASTCPLLCVSAQAIVLYSGLLTLLSTLGGYVSHTAIGISTLRKLWRAR